MKKNIFNSILVFISIVFWGCPARVPAVDETPPIISINISGEGVNETFQTTTTLRTLNVPEQPLFLHQNKTYTITAIASDMAVRHVSMEFPTNDFLFTPTSNNGHLLVDVAAPYSTTFIRANNQGITTPLNAMWFIGELRLSPTFRGGQKNIIFSASSQSGETERFGSTINLNVFLQATPF